MMARDSWHLGMLGHGAFLEGADKDIAAMDQLSQGLDFRTNPEFYPLPDYLSQDGLQEAAEALDQEDGEADGRWIGNPIIPLDGRIRYSPAWNVYQAEQLELLIENEELGVDDMPDLFYVNFKSTDLAGHEWNMLEEEVRAGPRGARSGPQADREGPQSPGRARQLRAVAHRRSWDDAHFPSPPADGRSIRAN